MEDEIIQQIAANVRSLNNEAIERELAFACGASKTDAETAWLTALYVVAAERNLHRLPESGTDEDGHLD